MKTMEAKAYYEGEVFSETNLDAVQRVVSVAAGSYLLSTAVKEARESPINAVLRVIGGSYLLYRGATGYCAIQEAFTSPGKVLNIRNSMMVNASPYEVYMLWRDLKKLPTFMKHLASVQEVDNTRSHWVAKLPVGVGTIEWDAEILIDRKGEELSWHSVDEAEVENSGKLVFEAVNGGQSTLLHVTITYSPPAGKVGKAVSRLLNDVFENMIREDLKRFRQMVEGKDSNSIELKPNKVNGIVSHLE